jgi:hypothetical protein
LEADVRRYLEKAFLQGEQLNDLVLGVQKQRARGREDKDRILHFLQDSFRFFEGENTVQNLVFNLPFADNFEAVRLYLWPSTRLAARDPKAQAIGVPALPTENTFRPTFWTAQARLTTEFSSIDALVEMSVSFPNGKTRSYQNSAWPASQTFSFSGLSDNSSSVFNRTNAAGALVFDPCLLLERGSAVTLRITPLFAAAYLALVQQETGAEPGPDADRFVREYQITGVLEGYKRQ